MEIKENVLACIYTTKGKDAEYQLSRFSGVEECITEDGGIKINRSHYLTNYNIQEVYLHPADHQVMAISPNNGSFLLNMSAPLVSFILVLKQYQQGNKFGIFQINIIN